MSEEMTLAIVPAITVKGSDRVFDSLTLREPKVGELVEAARNATGLGVVRNLAAIVSGWPTAAVNEIPVSQFGAVSAFLEGFLKQPISGD